MYRTILESIAGIEIWPVVALVIFFAFFVGVLVWVIRLKKEHVEEMANIPLEDDEGKLNNGDLSHG